MSYNFDTPFDKVAVKSGKWRFGYDVIGMGLAEMDFPIPQQIRDAISARAQLGEFGYVSMWEEDYQAVIDWLHDRTGVVIPREHIIATNGVLYTMRTALYALTKPGDKVIIQTPLHTPSIATASMQDRVALENRLIYRDGDYFIDFDQLEDCFRQGARALLMCAPNNPTGRVWTREELEQIGQLCERYDAIVISDEIHRDIIWCDRPHISPTEIPSLAMRSVATTSTSKTFNMGGFHIGTAIIPNEDLRNRVRKQFYYYGHACNRPSALCIAAQTAAYTMCKEWFEDLMTYMRGNFELALDYLADTPIRAKMPDGTFLLWGDVSEMKIPTNELEDVMQKEWRVVFDRGILYDRTDFQNRTDIEHHVRMNLATQRKNVDIAFDRIRKYFKK